MPFGIAKSKGGDSPQNVAKMERCIQSVMSKQGVSKPQAIAICKDSIGGKRKRRD